MRSVTTDETGTAYSRFQDFGVAVGEKQVLLNLVMSMEMILLMHGLQVLHHMMTQKLQLWLW